MNVLKKRTFLGLIDGAVIYLAYLLALILRFSGDFSTGEATRFFSNFQSIIWLYALIGVLVLFAAGFYKKPASHTGIIEVFVIISAISISTLIHIALPYLLAGFQGYFLPRSVIGISFSLQILLITGVRVAWKYVSDKEFSRMVRQGLKKEISFSPPDITEKEIQEVTDAMRSGWITTGPRTKEFEKRIAEYCGVEKAVCLNSATAAMELTLRLLGVGPGDEVITSAYTYTATAAVIHHTGAKIVLVDTGRDSFEMDPYELEEAITEKTKAILAVDIGGKICDYDSIYQAVEGKKELFKPASDLQKLFNRVVVIADSAHAFGARQQDKIAGQIADFTCFSFHAVKNLTTAEGGAVVWRNDRGIDNDELYKLYMLYSLHGQSKDALAKSQKGAWEYDIMYPAFKMNMTDILAGCGLMQLGRYDEMLKRRKDIVMKYDEAVKKLGLERLEHYGEGYASTGHLYLVRVPKISEEKRNQLIVEMAENGVTTNVHYKPLPMFTAYRNLGFDIENFPNAYKMYENEISLPLHTKLSDEDVEYILKTLKKALKKVLEKKVVKEKEKEYVVGEGYVS